MSWFRVLNLRYYNRQMLWTVRWSTIEWKRFKAAHLYYQRPGCKVSIELGRALYLSYSIGILALNTFYLTLEMFLYGERGCFKELLSDVLGLSTSFSNPLDLDIDIDIRSNWKPVALKGSGEEYFVWCEISLTERRMLRVFRKKQWEGLCVLFIFLCWLERAPSSLWSRPRYWRRYCLTHLYLEL